MKTNVIILIGVLIITFLGCIKYSYTNKLKLILILRSIPQKLGSDIKSISYEHLLFYSNKKVLGTFGNPYANCFDAEIMIGKNYKIKYDGTYTLNNNEIRFETSGINSIEMKRQCKFIISSDTILLYYRILFKNQESYTSQFEEKYVVCKNNIKY